MQKKIFNKRIRMKKKPEFKFNFKKQLKIKSIKELPDRPILINLKIPSTTIMSRRREEACSEYDEMIDNESLENEELVVKTKLAISDFCVIAGRIRKYRKKDENNFNLSYYAIRNTVWQLYQENKQNVYYMARYVGCEIVCRYTDLKELENTILIRKIKITPIRVKNIYILELEKITECIFTIALAICKEKKLNEKFEWEKIKKIDFTNQKFFSTYSKLFSKLVILDIGNWSTVLFKAVISFHTLFLEFKFICLCLSNAHMANLKRTSQNFLNEFIKLTVPEKSRNRWKRIYKQCKNKYSVVEENFADKLISKIKK